MKTKRLLLIFAALALIVSGALMLHPYPRQMVFGPKYNGVPLWIWQEDYRQRSRANDKKSNNDVISIILAWLDLNQASPPE